MGKEQVLRIYGDGDVVRIVIRDPEKDAGSTITVRRGEFSLANALGGRGREVFCDVEVGYPLPPDPAVA